ncbi:MAG: hypothetical protein RL367_349 [Pseudomonadota bacterium]
MMRYSIQICDTAAQMLQREATLTSPPFNGTIIYRTPGPIAETGDFVRQIVTGSGGQISTSPGKALEAFAEKFVLIAKI